jgi:hypothetical protein
MEYKTVIIIILAITLIVVVGLCIYFIYNSVSIQSKFISPSKCAITTNEFSVNPLTSGNTILNTCGTDGTTTCTFTNIANLSEAINTCHQYANICTMFSYAPGILNTGTGPPQGVMNIISPTGGLSSSTTYDTYTQQILSTLTT